MSAAEKLKALGEAKNGYFGIGHSSDWTLVDALPQIVAVVGELGFAISDLQTLLDSDALTKTGRKKLENHIRCHRAALAALDEALGDVT